MTIWGRWAEKKRAQSGVGGSMARNAGNASHEVDQGRAGSPQVLEVS